MLKLISLLTVLLVYYVNPINTVSKKIECGYKQCPQTRDGALNVHIISHSHMDAGWVKTFDEYYYGTRTSVSSANVQLIYHSVLSELLHDKRRKFTFSETSYFWRWWKEQRPATRATFRTLVQEGRIEFAGGSWVLNDEATPDYLQIIDQYTWGLRKLNDTLGPCGKPKAAWQIDSYGHSREQASLLAQMGYDGLFIGRVDHKERDAMIDEDRMEFMWRGSDVLGKMSDIMTHTMFNLYNAPEGFCFDFLCNDEPIVDDPDNRVFNADKRISDFVVQIERQAKYYDHDNIMVTMGGDFTYQSAASWFINLDKLINHITTHPANMSDINIFYSTPSCYLKSVYLFGKRDKALYTEKGDHFPYGSDSATYWTGFYSSRPALKYFINRAHIFLQVVKQLTVLAGMGDSYELHLLRHAISLSLHHDVITGTSQQHVINDFVKTIYDAVEACSKKVSQLLTYLTPTWGASRRSKTGQQFVICHQLNISQCKFAETQEGMLIMVYNPLSMKTYHHVRLPALALHYSIRDYNDEEVEYQLLPNPTAIINLPGRSSASIQELYFEAENIPPLGFTAFYILPVRDQLEENEYAKKVNNGFDEMHQEVADYISNEVALRLRSGHYQLRNFVYLMRKAESPNWDLRRKIDDVHHLTMECATNSIKRESLMRSSCQSIGINPVRVKDTKMTDLCLMVSTVQSKNKGGHRKTYYPSPVAAVMSACYLKVTIDKNTGLLSSIQHVDGIKIEVSQNFYYYSQSQQSLQSGAYSFRPDKQRPIPATERATYNSVRGTLVKEIRQRFTDWITQIIRLYRGEEYIEIEWVIGPVPVSTDLGREVVTIFSTNISNRGELYTDANSRQMMRRTCKNETTKQQQKKSVAGCYYPVTSRICIRSSNTSEEMCVLTDRAQGGTSFNEGEIELMVHRRLLTDDGFGLEESLNEEAHGVGLVVKGKHRIVFGNMDQEVDGLTHSERVAQAARKWQLEPWLFFTSGDKISRRKWQNVRNKRYSALRLHGLPRHIHILTLEPWKSGSVLLRLENTLEKPNRGPFKTSKVESPEDYATKSSHIIVDLRKIFLQMPIKKVRETTLAANQWLDDARQMDWSTRYVYNGSDDGILSDDGVDESDDKPITIPETEREPGSDEDINNSRRHRLRQETNRYKVKNAYKDYQRRKRSSNETERINKSIFITTVNDGNVDGNMQTDINASLAQAQSKTQINKSKGIENNMKHVKKNPRLSILSTERLNNRETTTEEGDSDEEYTIHKNRSSKRRNRKIINMNFKETQSENVNDDITKSIYEMYYKTRSRTKPFKPLLRSSEETELITKRKRNKSRRYRLNDDEVELTTNRLRNKRRGKGVVADMPFFIREKKIKNKNRRVVEYEKKMEKVNSEEDDQIREISPKSNHKIKGAKHENDEQETQYLEDDDDGDFDKKSIRLENQAENNRRKRTLSKRSENPDPPSDEETDSTEPQFVVTLRPTQIRTFVIWFEIKKKSYVL